MEIKKVSVEMEQIIGKRILVDVGFGPVSTTVKELSPNGEYVNFVRSCEETEGIGWYKVEKIKVLDIF